MMQVTLALNGAGFQEERKNIVCLRLEVMPCVSFEYIYYELLNMKFLVWFSCGCHVEELSCSGK